MSYDATYFAFTSTTTTVADAAFVCFEFHRHRAEMAMVFCHDILRYGSHHGRVSAAATVVVVIVTVTCFLSTHAAQRHPASHVTSANQSEGQVRQRAARLDLH